MTNDEKLRLANLRLDIIRLVTKPSTDKHTLLCMKDAYRNGRKEASEMGRKIYESKQSKVRS
jgi:hypothetical protein